MSRHYTRVCNFYYGNQSKYLVSKKKAIPLHQIKEISFDQIEIVTRKSKKRISINHIKYLPKILKTKINLDLKKIKSKKKNFSNLNFKKIPNILGVLNLTPDSFSDGGKFNSKKKGFKQAIKLLNSLGFLLYIDLKHFNKIAVGTSCILGNVVVFVVYLDRLNSVFLKLIM